MRATIEKWIILAILTGLWTALALAYWPANAEEVYNFQLRATEWGDTTRHNFTIHHAMGTAELTTTELQGGSWVVTYNETFPVTIVKHGLKQRGYIIEGDGLYAKCTPDGWHTIGERGVRWWHRDDSAGSYMVYKQRFKRTDKRFKCEVDTYWGSFLGKGQHQLMTVEDLLTP